MLPCSINESVQEGLIPLILENSYAGCPLCCCLSTQITPSVLASAFAVLVKNNLYCVFSGITTDSNAEESKILSSNID